MDDRPLTTCVIFTSEQLKNSLLTALKVGNIFTKDDQNVWCDLENILCIILNTLFIHNISILKSWKYPKHWNSRRHLTALDCNFNQFQDNDLIVFYCLRKFILWNCWFKNCTWTFYFSQAHETICFFCSRE